MKLKATGLVQDTKNQSGCLSRHLPDYDDLDYKRLRQTVRLFNDTLKNESVREKS